MSKTSSLEERVAAAIEGGPIASADLYGLIAEAEEALDKAEETAQAVA